MKVSSFISSIKVNTLRTCTQGVDLLRRYPRQSLIAFISLLLIFFIPYTFDFIVRLSSSPGTIRIIILVYYPLRVLLPPIIVGWYSYKVPNALLASSIGFVPLFLLALSELSWKSFLAVLREDFYFAFALILLGIGIGPLLRKVHKYGLFIALMGIILWIGGVINGIFRYIDIFLNA